MHICAATSPINPTIWTIAHRQLSVPIHQTLQADVEKLAHNLHLNCWDARPLCYMEISVETFFTCARVLTTSRSTCIEPCSAHWTRYYKHYTWNMHRTLRNSYTSRIWIKYTATGLHARYSSGGFINTIKMMWFLCPTERRASGISSPLHPMIVVDKWHQDLGNLIFHGARPNWTPRMFGQIQESLHHVDGRKVTLTKGIHKALEYLQCMSKYLECCTTLLYNLVPLHTTLYGYHNMSGYMCGVAVLPEPTAVPLTLHIQPSSEQKTSKLTGAHPKV